MDLSNKFKILIREFLKSTNGVNVSDIKKHFVGDISSTRCYYRICSMKELLEILEERDCLDERNVSRLKVIGSILNNENIKHLIQAYEKINLLDEHPTCSLCGMTQDFVPCEPNLPPMPKVPELPLPNSGVRNVIYQDINDLNNAITALSINLGHRWPALLRVLNTKECFIDLTKKQFESTVDQARHALNMWCQRNENVSIDTLQNALSQNECRRLGLGPWLTEIEPCFVTIS